MSFCNVIITREFYIPEIRIGTFAFLKGHLGFENGYRYGGLRQYINNNVDWALILPGFVLVPFMWIISFAFTET